MKKPGRTYIIEEDEHLENLRKIIKRDFFSSEGDNQKSDTIQLSLNEYIHNFKSNENKIFSELVEADKEKWKNQHWWFDKQDKLLMIEKQKYQALKNESHQYQNMIQKHQTTDNKLAITGQQAKNSIFFNSDKNYGSYLTDESQQAKKIYYKNCRLDDGEQKTIQQKQQSKQSDEEQDQNPITWGQVQATPLRINKGQSQYRIPDRPDKDVLLDKLNQKISKGKIEAQSSSRKSELIKKIMGSSTPGYKNSSYVRTSSIKRIAPSTPLNGRQVPQTEVEMKGLLKFEK